VVDSSNIMRTPQRADAIVPANENERAVLGFHTALMANDMERFDAIWTDDAVHEIPFRVEGVVPALIGRKQIVEDYRRMFRNRRDMVFTIKSLHQSTDPDCIIVEFRGVSFVTETGALYDQNYIGVFHLKGGKICLMRIYCDPLVSERALSGMMARVDAAAPTQ
jgi:uncharacterized protein